jgi:hypothetical protein
MNWTPLILAFFGGLAVNLLNLMELQNVPKDRRPDFKDPLYWLPYVIWPLMGGLLAYIYEASNNPLKPIIAFQVGASAPLIIRAMARAVPSQTGINPGAGE